MNADYLPLVFPHTAGGGPGVVETVVLTVSASGSGSDSNPTISVADRAAYYAATTANKQRHARFADIVRYMSQYGTPVYVTSGNSTITLGFEQKDMFEDSAKGKPGWFNAAAARKNMYELAQAYVAANDFFVDSISVTIDGVSQSS